MLEKVMAGSCEKFHENIPSDDQEIQEIVNMAHCIEGEGLSDMVPGEVQELLQEPNYELTQEDLD
jgi:hypothetical protein